MCPAMDLERDGDVTGADVETFRRPNHGAVAGDIPGGEPAGAGVGKEQRLVAIVCRGTGDGVRCVGPVFTAHQAHFLPPRSIYYDFSG